MTLEDNRIVSALAAAQWQDDDGNWIEGRTDLPVISIADWLICFDDPGEATLDAAERSERLEAAETWRAERQRLEAAEQSLDELCRAVEQFTAAELEAAGFHRPKRGPWRRKRGHP